MNAASHGLPRAHELEARLRERLAPTHLEVIDESAAHAGHAGAGDEGFGTHFRVRIQASCFTGQTRLACHRLVYDALHDFMARGLHALAIEVQRQPPAPPAPEVAPLPL